MELLILAFEALKERRIRSALTILMVIVGVALLVAVDGISTGTKHFIEGEFQKFGTNIIIVSSRRGNVVIDDSLVDDISKIPGVKAVIPVISKFITIEVYGQTKDVIVVGMDLSKINYLMPELKLESGILPPETDIFGIVLGYQVAYNPDGTKFAYTGEAVKITYTTFEEGRQKVKEGNFIVRGVFDYFGSFFIPVDQNVWMPLETAKKFFEQNEYDGLYIVTENGTINEKIAEFISQQYKLEVLTPQQINIMVNRILITIDIYILSVSLISLLVASIGIITTLYTSVLERIREIGTLKAIGFKNSDVMRMFLYEALIIGVIGTVVGALIGVFGSYLLKTLFFSQIPFIQPEFEAATFIKTAVLAVGLSIISGLYPAYRAAKLNPVEALRWE